MREEHDGIDGNHDRDGLDGSEHDDPPPTLSSSLTHVSTPRAGCAVFENEWARDDTPTSHALRAEVTTADSIVRTHEEATRTPRVRCVRDWLPRFACLVFVTGSEGRCERGTSRDEDHGRLRLGEEDVARTGAHRVRACEPGRR